MADDQSTIASSSRPATPTTTRPNLPAAGPSAIRQPLYRFAWDSPSRRVGPGSVADTVDSRADFLSPHAIGTGHFGGGSNFQNLNFSFQSLHAAAIPPEWSSSKYGLNAISTVLNNPHKKGDPPKAHAPVPPVKPAILPRVKRKDFDGYLRAVAPEWEKYQRNKQAGKEGTAYLESDGSRQFRVGKEIPPLESVPPVYFDNSFDLTKPATFAKVVEQKENGELLDPSALSHSLPLLEKMSHYADTIELHLIREISQRSSSFFEALSNLQDLQTESEQCLNRISRLREMLHDVDEQGAKRGLEVVRLRKRLENLQSVQEGLKVVESAGETMTVARSLVSGGDWDEALNFIDGLREAWQPNDLSQSVPVIPPPRTSSMRASIQLASVDESEEHETTPPSPPKTSINLSSLQAFATLPTQLQALSLQISSALTNDLVSAFRIGLQSKMDLQTSQEQEASQEMLDPDLWIKMTPLLQGLIRTKNIKNGLIALRGVALNECRSATKRFVSIPDPDDFVQEGSEATLEEFTPAFSQHVQAQSQSDFIKLISSMFEVLLRFLRVLQSHHSFIMGILREEAGNSDSMDLSSLESELGDSLSEASELANLQTSKVLNLRSEQHAALDLTTFTNLFDTTWNFVVACEIICSKMFVGLRGAIIAQSKSFLSSFHAQRLSQSAKVVEEELWAPGEVTRQYQDIVNAIVDGAVQDPPSWKLQPPNINGVSNGSAKPESVSKLLQIENRTYYAVSATLQVLGIAVDYLRVIVNLPLTTVETMPKMVELLKSFNSRTCQVVLGAGAMRSAGLKNITAKHLALASQSLSIMIALVPYIRETFRRHLNAKQAVMLVEFDKLKRDYQEHQNEIHDKLISIMSDRITFHCKTLSEIDWAKVSQASSTTASVNEYMEQLIKETTTLGKVLSRYLPEPPVEYIMSQIFAAINHSLEEEYGKIELPNERAKEILLTDVRYLKIKISALKGVGNTSGMGMLEVIVNEKRAKDYVPVPPSRIASPPATSPVNPVPPPNSSPASTGIGAGLPTNIRRSPFAGNKRISSLLSSVTSIGKVVDKSDNSKSIIPVELPKEKAPLTEEPEPTPISSSQSLGFDGNKTDSETIVLQLDPDRLTQRPSTPNADQPASPLLHNSDRPVSSVQEDQRMKSNAPIPESLPSPSIPDSVPPAVPPKPDTNVHTATPIKEPRTVPLPPTPSSVDPSPNAIAEATSTENAT